MTDPTQTRSYQDWQSIRAANAAVDADLRQSFVGMLDDLIASAPNMMAQLELLAIKDELEA